MLIGQYLDYRQFLRDQLKVRTSENPQYSLRAFARDLEVAPQIVSQVLNGKKNISSEVAIGIAQKLRLKTDEVSYFHDLVELSLAKTDSLRTIIRYRLERYETVSPYRVLQADVFKIISAWQHYAILELSLTEDFDSSPAWIAKRLGITPTDARESIDRLLRLELFEEVDGRLVKTNVSLATPQDVPSAAVKKLTSQLLTKADAALETQSIEERDFGTMTMAIDPLNLPEAKARIRKFRRELCALLESGNKTEVYALSTQLFKLTNS